MVSFERFLHFKKSGGNHCHWNAIAVPPSQGHRAETAFQEASTRANLSLQRVAGPSRVRPLQLLSATTAVITHWQRHEAVCWLEQRSRVRHTALTVFAQASIVALQAWGKSYAIESALNDAPDAATEASCLRRQKPLARPDMPVSKFWPGLNTPTGCQSKHCPAGKGARHKQPGTGNAELKSQALLAGRGGAAQSQGPRTGLRVLCRYPALWRTPCSGKSAH